MQQRLIGAGKSKMLAGTVGDIAPSGPVLVLGGTNSFPAETLSTGLDELPSRQIILASGRIPDTETLNHIWTQISVMPTCIVAIGGGRVLDLAKLLSTGLRDVDDLVAQISDGSPALRKVPLIVVPTTAGSGSESTPFAVLYNKGVKLSLDHPSMLPDVAIVDCKLMQTAPSKVRAASGFDALCQGIEALLSRGATEQSDAIALRAVKGAKCALLPALAGDPDAAAEMAQAANLAGRAIAITRTTVPHALSYPLTARFGVPHGHAVALSMGKYLQHFGHEIQSNPALSPWSASFDVVLKELGVATPDDIPENWNKLVSDAGLAPSLTTLNLPADARLQAATAVNPNRLRNAPLLLDTPTLASFFA